MKSRGTPSLVITEARGSVIAQNESARRLMGNGVGRACWDVVGALPDAEGLPCRPGCVSRLLQSGLERASHAPIRLAGRGELLSCIPVNQVVVCVLSGGARADDEPQRALTPREVEVLRLVADGATTAEIAERLGVSGATARTHVENMRTKLGAATRARLVALGFRLGILN